MRIAIYFKALFLIVGSLSFTSCKSDQEEIKNTLVYISAITASADNPIGLRVFNSSGDELFYKITGSNESIELDNGRWSFQFVRFPGFPGYDSANFSCGVVSNRNLEGGDITLTIDMSIGECSNVEELPIFMAIGGNPFSGHQLQIVDTVPSVSPDGCESVSVMLWDGVDSLDAPFDIALTITTGAGSPFSFYQNTSDCNNDDNRITHTLISQGHYQVSLFVKSTSASALADYNIQFHYTDDPSIEVSQDVTAQAGAPHSVHVMSGTSAFVGDNTYQFNAEVRDRVGNLVDDTHEIVMLSTNSLQIFCQTIPSPACFDSVSLSTSGGIISHELHAEGMAPSALGVNYSIDFEDSDNPLDGSFGLETACHQGMNITLGTYDGTIINSDMITICHGTHFLTALNHSRNSGCDEIVQVADIEVSSSEYQFDYSLENGCNYNGNNHTITINNFILSEQNGVRGLFSEIETGSELSNLNINYTGDFNFSADGDIVFGGIAGKLNEDSKVTNVHVNYQEEVNSINLTCVAANNSNIGGLIGLVNGNGVEVTNTSVKLNRGMNAANCERVGGLIGHVQGYPAGGHSIISKSRVYLKEDKTISGAALVGGFVGRIDGESLIKKSFFNGSVGTGIVANAGNNAGGFVGRISDQNSGGNHYWPEIKNSYALVNNIQAQTKAGGFLGSISSNELNGAGPVIQYSYVKTSGSGPITCQGGCVEYGAFSGSSLGSDYSDKVVDSYWLKNDHDPTTPAVGQSGSSSIEFVNSQNVLSESIFPGLSFTDIWSFDGVKNRPVLVENPEVALD